MTVLVHEVRSEVDGDLLLRHYVLDAATFHWTWGVNAPAEPWYEVWYGIRREQRHPDPARQADGVCEEGWAEVWAYHFEVEADSIPPGIEVRVSCNGDLDGDVPAERLAAARALAGSLRLS